MFWWKFGLFFCRLRNDEPQEAGCAFFTPPFPSFKYSWSNLVLSCLRYDLLCFHMKQKICVVVLAILVSRRDQCVSVWSGVGKQVVSCGLMILPPSHNSNQILSVHTERCTFTNLVTLIEKLGNAGINQTFHKDFRKGSSWEACFFSEERFLKKQI